MLEQITVKELNEECHQYLHIKVDNPSKATTIIEKMLGTIDFEVMTDGGIRLYKYLDNPGKVSTLLFNQGLVIEQFMPMGEDLEGYFTNLTG